MIISLGSDHAGFEQKDALAAFLVDEGHDVVLSLIHISEPTRH